MLKSLRKAFVQQKLVLSEEDMKEFKKNWTNKDNFQTRYDTILITKQVCLASFGEGACDFDDIFFDIDPRPSNQGFLRDVQKVIDHYSNTKSKRESL